MGRLSCAFTHHADILEISGGFIAFGAIFSRIIAFFNQLVIRNSTVITTMSSFTNWDQKVVEELKMEEEKNQEKYSSSTKPKSNHQEFDYSSVVIIKDDEKISERNSDTVTAAEIDSENFRENKGDDELPSIIVKQEDEEEPKNVQNLKKRVSELKNGLEIMKNEFLILRGNYSRLEITHSKKFYRKKKAAMKQELHRIMSELNEEQKSQDFAYHTKNIKSVDNSEKKSEKNHPEKMTTTSSINGFC